MVPFTRRRTPGGRAFRRIFGALGALALVSNSANFCLQGMCRARVHAVSFFLRKNAVHVEFWCSTSGDRPKDLAVPVVPLRSFMPGSRNPMLNISWNDASTLCLPSECVVLDLRDERTCQVRPHRGTAGRNLVRCTEMCHTPAGLLSVWSDGAVHLKPRCQINFGKENGVRGKTQTLGEDRMDLVLSEVFRSTMAKPSTSIGTCRSS